jgi:hypothetical protein
LQRLQRQLAGLKLLIVDELGYVPLSPTGAELLFEVFSQRFPLGADSPHRLFMSAPPPSTAISLGNFIVSLDRLAKGAPDEPRLQLFQRLRRKLLRHVNLAQARALLGAFLR